MCFKNLPVEFDAEGNPRLKKGGEHQWAVRREPRPADRARPGGDEGEHALTSVVSVHGLHTLLVRRRPAGAGARPTTPRSLN